MSDAILVELRKTGGIMGMDETLLIRSDGSGFAIGFNARRADFELNQTELEELSTLVQGVDIGTVKPKKGRVRDAVYHTVRIEGKSATTATGDSNIADEFLRLVGALDELLRTKGGI